MIKYPRIPHVPGSKSTEDDIVRSQFPRGEFYVYEKLDGASLGISMVDGVLRLQNRGGYLENKRPHEQWDAAKNWAYMNYEILIRFFESVPSGVIFGEWLYAKHSIYYTRLESFFVGFDIFTGKGLVTDPLEIAEIIKTIGLAPSPIVAATNDIEKFLGAYRHTPLYGEEYEGFIFRDKHGSVYKYVRPEFTSGIKEHWFNTELVRNRMGTAS
jgi:ATP-dependent RNA circularization protein (DNA/RNA ligase family)